MLDHTIDEEPEIDEEIDFERGSLIQAQLPNPLVFETSYGSGDKPHHFFDYSTSIPVVSGLFADALRAVGIDNFELFPAVLRNPETGAEWGNYFAFNVLGLVDATDLESSRYSEIMAGNEDGEPALVSFDVLALKRDLLSGLEMFREPNGGCLVMSERAIRTVLASSPEEGFGIIAHEVVLT
ncbi:MAG: hypothetical protein H6832_03235 [Planctomycetes bacterium]|nr:hypothetical protein [Planctomycetota bacterium]